MSHLTQSMVEQFFELEKESARGVLRKEMDSAMDTIFKQMKQKLMQLVDNVELGNLNETLNEQGDLGDPVHHEQLYDSFNYANPIPSTSTNPQAYVNVLNVSNLSQIDQTKVNSAINNCDKSTNDPIFKQMKRKLMMLMECGPGPDETGHGLAYLGDHLHHDEHEQPLHSSSNQIPSASTNSRTPYNSNSNQDDEIIVKNELDEIVNIIPNELILPSSYQSQPSNERSNDNIDNLFDELGYDDEDCDCPECVGDLFIVKEECDDQADDDHSHSAEDLIDESNDSISKPTKRPRLENDQLDYQVQPNNKYITISLKCSQCSKMFKVKDALNAHLKSAHSILKYRCLYKDCKRSFDKQHYLTRHYSTAHSNRPNNLWPCAYCSGHFKNNDTLFVHYLLFHEEGQFRCSYPDCQFVGELKQTVRNHFESSHKRFACQHAGCTNRYPNASQLKIHQLTHLDVKPYRCKWSNCQFDTAYKCVVLRHIQQHLKKVGKLKRGANISLDPNDYLEVLQDL